ncbi:hypothetical protein MAHJHV58_32950 [Mycobacterium avium subsp. hominissuis]|uniref:Uncharacterized protein n=1 Tax=Mycobacterium avium subsp. hominissuis TaxID=439334 RepID=A0AAI8SLB1_MYCAV|nr:hypothetical protein JPH1_29330 [Mycobacterium avium subsp. hominissuis]BCO41907.1 hypothetical protein MINTM001_30460 [Mycobacterium paraintracellulare]BCO52378.1 hypothetical protein MINTM003_28190 [Mycobacterium paraintracellulare]
MTGDGCSGPSGWTSFGLSRPHKAITDNGHRRDPGVHQKRVIPARDIRHRRRYEAGVRQPAVALRVIAINR